MKIKVYIIAKTRHTRFLENIKEYIRSKIRRHNIILS